MKTLAALAASFLLACGGIAAEPISGQGGDPPGGTTTPPGGTTTPPSGTTTPPGGTTTPPSTTPAVDDAVKQITLKHVDVDEVPGCYPKFRTVVYDRSTQTAVWVSCEAQLGGYYGEEPPPTPPGDDFPAASKILDAAAAAQVEQVLGGLTAHAGACDKTNGEDYVMSTVSTAGVTTTYAEHDVDCSGDRHVDGLEKAYDVLAQLSLN